MKSDDEIKNEAVKYIKKKSSIKMLIDKFSNPKKVQSDTYPVSVFMAGSPGAGKTEFSKRLIGILWENEDNKVVRIDTDEIRMLLPGYTGSNAHIFQYPASIGVDKMHDSVLHNKQNFILDGTLADFERAQKNVTRSLGKNRLVIVFYIYQDPITAWDFTLKREEIECRRIRKQDFIAQFFKAKCVVNELKKYFGKKVVVHLVEKDFKYSIVQFKANIDKIDNHIKFKYTKEQLEKILKSYGSD